MAITLLGNTKAAVATTSTATTAAQNTTGATLLIAVVCTFSGAASACTVSSTKNASAKWSHLLNYVNGSMNICIFYCANPTTFVSEIFSCNPNGTGYPLLMVSWWSGAATVTPQDQANGAASGTGTTLQPGSVTPTADNELVITGISDNDTGAKSISDAGGPTFTLQDSSVNNSFECGAWAYTVLGAGTSGTAVNPTWTEANTVSRSAAIATFKAAGGAFTGPYPDSYMPEINKVFVPKNEVIPY